MSRGTSASDSRDPAGADFAGTLLLARQGDRAALADLLTGIRPRLQVATKGISARTLRHRIRSSDVLQASFLEIIRDFDSFRGATEGEFCAWAVSVMQNAVRRTERGLDALKRKGPGSHESAERLLNALRPAAPSPSSIAQRGERADLVRAALSLLTDEHRQVLDLAVMKGLSHRQIAEQLGRSEGASRMLLVRARAAFALAMSRLDPDGACVEGEPMREGA